MAILAQLPTEQLPPVARLVPVQVAVQLLLELQVTFIRSHPIAMLPVPMSNTCVGAVVPIPTLPLTASPLVGPAVEVE